MSEIGGVGEASPEFGTFTNFITKGFGTEVTKDDRRILKGHITVEVVDRQNEFVAVDEVLSIIKNYFEVYPAIHDWHSNRPVGKALKYEKSEIEGHASVYIEAEIFKKDGVTLYDKVWEKIVKGEYTGFSMGGASKVREPMVKNGKLIMNLKSLELYEISVCPLPANQLAIFDYVNDFAKASGLNVKENLSGRRYIQCEGVECQFHKATSVYGEEKTGDLIKDSTYNLTINVDSSKLEEIIKNEVKKQYQAFQKPVRGHPSSYWMNKLKEENPEMTDADCKAKIDSWIGEEAEKKTVTKEMSRQAETVMDEAPKGDSGSNDEDKDSLMKDSGQSNAQAKAPNVKNTNAKEETIEEAKGELKVSEAGHRVTDEAREKAKEMGKADVDSDVDVDKTSKVRKELESMIRKNDIINIFVNQP